MGCWGSSVQPKQIFTKSLLLLSCILASGACHKTERAANTTEGKLLPGSSLPDGKQCLLEVHFGETTANGVIIASSDRTRDFELTDVVTEYTTTAPTQGRVTIVWAPDNKRVAIHDSIAKHSEVVIYRRGFQRFERVPTGDILGNACAYWNVERDQMASSGQRPIGWSAEGALTIDVSARVKDGQELRHRLQVLPSS